MKLIIDIPEEKYKTIQEGMYCGMLDADLYRDIKNGIPHETVTEFADRCRECGREKVLGKIKAEIESNINQLHENGERHAEFVRDNGNHIAEGLELALQIIDKHQI